VQSEAVYANEAVAAAPVVLDGGCSPTEPRASAAAAASGGTAATTIITEVRLQGVPIKIPPPPLEEGPYISSGSTRVG